MNISHFVLQSDIASYSTSNRASDISRKKKQNFAGFSGANSRDFRGKKVNFQRIFRGKFLGKSADFPGNFGGKLRQETISKKQPISLGFFGKFD